MPSSRSSDADTCGPFGSLGVPAASTCVTIRSVSSMAPPKKVTNWARTFLRSGSSFVVLAKTALAFARLSSHVARAEQTEPV